MKPDHLYRHTFMYAMLKKITSFYHSIYYEEICVFGSENIPEKQPIIFTPNHQNALMDALAIIHSTHGQTLFMARADIFKKDLNRKILHAIKIIPVYRMRDGIDSLSNNDESFEIAFQVLKNNGIVGIMPEGNHGEQRRLRPLKKGFARLAIQSQELMNSGQLIKIVPVGIDYSDYKTLRGKLLVIFGKPIEVIDFLKEYKGNPAKALQSMKAKVTEALTPLMINIDSEVYYETIYQAKELYSNKLKSKFNSLFDKFKIEKLLVDKLVGMEKSNEAALKQLKIDMDELQDKSERLKLEPWIFGWKPNRPVSEWLWDLSRTIVFFPIFLFTLAFHAVPFFISEYYANKVKDKQFISSMRFAVSFVLYLIWYLIFLCWPISTLLKGLFIIGMPILGILSIDYWKSLKIMRIQFQYLRLKKQNDPLISALQDMYDGIIQQLSTKVNV
jgi:1-acyl-sn-glycerol-3-phosphate acyltransferase